jgi:hypothetical protein
LVLGRDAIEVGDWIDLFVVELLAVAVIAEAQQSTYIATQFGESVNSLSSTIKTKGAGCLKSKNVTVEQR